MHTARQGEVVLQVGELLFMDRQVVQADRQPGK